MGWPTGVEPAPPGTQPGALPLSYGHHEGQAAQREGCAAWAPASRRTARRDATGRRGSNPPPPGWHPGALPTMSYCRVGWSWRESNPRPQDTNRGCYDHSRVCGLRLPPRRVERIARRVILPPVLSPVSAVFACCQRVSPRRPPLLLVPGCSGLAPRAIAGRSAPRPARSAQAARARASLSASLWVPRLKSLGNSGRNRRLVRSCIETDQPRVSCWWWREWDSNPRNAPKVLRLMRPASTPLLRPAAKWMMSSGGRGTNPLLRDGVPALYPGELPPHDVKTGRDSPWWSCPAGGHPRLSRPEVGCSPLGVAPAAADTTHTRPQATFVWSGSRASNPVLLLGRQELYQLSYCRFMWLLSSGRLTPVGETFSRSVSRSPCTVRICAARPTPEAQSRVVACCCWPPCGGRRLLAAWSTGPASRGRCVDVRASSGYSATTSPAS